MLISPALASLRVSLNHLFTQSETTSDRETRVSLLLLLTLLMLSMSELLSIFVFFFNFSRPSTQ
uniref:Uncharacterized protein MANES_09G113200 n=1 Tax=Rhizophora mucronata TaxID=61149 RepID=A0A2P2JNT3_RHIMU